MKNFNLLFIICLLIGCSNLDDAERPVKLKTEVFPTVADNGSEIDITYPDYGPIIWTKIQIPGGDVWTEGENFNGYRLVYHASMPLYSTDYVTETNTYWHHILESHPQGHSITSDEELYCMYKYKVADITGLEGMVIWVKVTLLNSAGFESPQKLLIPITIQN
jgi:hypothetical protein